MRVSFDTSALAKPTSIDQTYQDPHIVRDMTDSANLIRIAQQVRPDEIHKLAAMNHVAVSFEEPEYTANADGLMHEVPQKEITPLYARIPYAVENLYAYWITVNYREAYGIYACNGILFNHESPVCGATYVTRKITRAIARIALGLQDCQYLGNMSALRDWGYAQMQWLMLQQDVAEDFCIVTGVQCSVREFVQRAAAELGIAVEIRGEGADEVGIVARVEGDKARCKPGDVIVKVDPRYFRPTEVETLLGDPTNAKLGWKPITTFEELVREMVQRDYTWARRDELPNGAGLQAFDHHA